MKMKRSMSSYKGNNRSQGDNSIVYYSKQPATARQGS